MYAIPCVFLFCYFSLHLRCTQGGLAQLARAFDWQSKGQEFDSPNLHKIIKIPLVYQYIMRGIFILHACLHTVPIFNLILLTVKTTSPAVLFQHLVQQIKSVKVIV